MALFGEIFRFINGRMSIGARLVLLTILFAAPIVVLQTWIVVQNSREIDFLNRELDGAAYLADLWPVFVDTTRGARAGDRLLGEESRVGADRFHAASEWTRFVATSDRDAVPAGAVLIARVADGSNLTLDRDLRRFYLSDVATVGLPNLMAATSRLAEIRADSYKTPARAKRATAIYQRVETAAEELDSAFTKAIRDNPSPVMRGALIRERDAVATAVKKTLRDRAAIEEGSGAPPDVDGLLSVSDHAWRASHEELSTLLRRERDRLARTLVLNLLGVTVSVVAALALAFAIHRGVTQRISAILGAMSRLLRGDLQVEVPHLDDRNETGSLAHTVLALKESLVARARLEEASIAAARAKTEFLGNISHEIRTPLNGVVGVASALVHTQLTADQRAMVDLICASGQTVERLLADVLDISKIESGGLQLELAPFDLKQVVADAVRLFSARAAEKGVALVLELDDSLDGAFEGDAIRLGQVLSNLVSNAIKFTDHGVVTVTATVNLSGVRGGCSELVAFVRDTGLGFDEALGPYLFERFTQADSSISRRYGGSGLGLSICKAIIDMMGGDIRVESAIGKGSEFRVTVPLRRMARAKGADETTADSFEDAQARPPRILLVEDHEVNRAVVDLLLAPLGVELVMAHDGQEGVRRFEEASFDLVLMDIQMPVMDGLAATRRMRDLERERAAPRTRIVMLTANVSPEHQLVAMAAGADAHLAKPINRERLWDVVMGQDAGEARGRSANDLLH